MRDGAVASGDSGFRPARLPREMVLASAGSGKTYYLSSRLIGLLARGVAPETIWASTFTRKAASEILERVLLRLARGALDAEKARELAHHAWIDPDRPRPDDFLTPEQCGRLLSELVMSLHRANIGTLDSFFVQVASTFARELGLSPTWRLVEGPEEDRIRSDSLEAVLSQRDSGVMAELVRIMARGDVRRGVHSDLLDQVETLLEAHREVDETAGDAWFHRFQSESDEENPSREEVRRRCEALATGIESAIPPLNKDGTPNSGWEKELLRLGEAIRSRDWKAFFSKGLGKKLLETAEVAPAGDVTYLRHKPETHLASLVDDAVALARAELAREISRQSKALGRLAGWYRDAFEAAQEKRGGYRFGDITHLLRESAILNSPDDLYFRLDARIQHLLLDEFQDTSQAQWEVLEPVVGEILSGGEAERAVVVVADPKQSIYGWRGARPGLVHEVRELHALAHEELDKSFRSGPVILDAVREVFSSLANNPVIEDLDGGEDVARVWMKDLYPQRANDEDQPGYVELRVGPRIEGSGGIQSGLLDYAAGLVRDLHAREPRASVGVLVRTNRVVSYMIKALRELGVPASGEGGTPLTDAAPVNAVLALLRMADHPGDRLARYHVAHTPIGEVVGYTDHQAGAEARRTAVRIRGRLLREGYGVTLNQWAKEVEGSCSPLERARLLQLVELGFQWDGERTLRPGDFVRLVENQGVEDPSGARVRVMTVHQSKGLEFDVVVLPHLYGSLATTGGRDPLVPLRDESTGRVVRVFPSTDAATRILLPELQEAFDQHRASRLRDDLSALYVAMTRTRYAAHLIVPADGDRGPGTSRSLARLLREALTPGKAAQMVGDILYQHGDPVWFEDLPGGDFRGPAVSPSPADSPFGPTELVRLKPAEGARIRNLARRTPSSMEGGEFFDLSAHLRMDLEAEARRRGTIAHAFCEAVEWMEKGLPLEGLPDDETLIALARDVAPGSEEARIREWISDFKVWMGRPAVRRVLDRSNYPAGARVERELPFLQRVPGGILQGYIDRLVLLFEDGEVVGAEILDFKTDALDASDARAIEERVAFYRPQIDAYRTAVAGRYGLDPSAVTGKLLFLRPGLVVDVD